MQRGDRAFRQSNYREAYANFQIANDLGDHDAESYVCLLHAQFALSSVSYAQACYFLEQALRHMPELPLANLRPRGFYDSPDKYAQQLVALQENVEKNPGDHEAILLLAYFRWFEQERDVAGTRDLLSKALAAGQEKRDPLVIETVETFWRGVVATGAASGELVPQPAKTPETMPAK
jgi:tetratricopeptide (TPR) repeat protein